MQVGISVVMGPSGCREEGREEEKGAQSQEGKEGQRNPVLRCQAPVSLLLGSVHLPPAGGLHSHYQ